MRGGGQDRERQQVPAAEQVAQRRNARVGAQIGPLDIQMRDAGPAGARDFVARADDMAAGADFYLGRPYNAGQQRGGVDHGGGVGRDRVRVRDWRLGTHTVQRHGAGRDGRRVGVLQPQHHALARRWGRHAGITVGRPGICVVRDGQAGLIAAAIGVERVFHHVVPDHADGMDEQLALERRQPVAGADVLAVDRDASRADRLLPLRNRGAGAVIQA